MGEVSLATRSAPATKAVMGAQALAEEIGGPGHDQTERQDDGLGSRGVRLRVGVAAG